MAIPKTSPPGQKKVGTEGTALPPPGVVVRRRLFVRNSSAPASEQASEAENQPLPQARPPWRAHLQWRRPWWLWQGAACAASTFLAPTFLAIGGLLIRDAHSDHPVFWPSLMLSVALANLLAMAAMNQLHHRQPFTGRQRLAAGYGAFSMLAGSVFFLVLGWASGFLHDFVVPLFGGGGSPAKAILWSLALAAAYGLLSFAHASLVFVWVCFRDPGHDSEWLDGIGWRLG